MGRFGVELLLILFALLEILGVITTYIISVVREDVKPFLPPISNTGNKPPESCVFSFVLSCGAIISFIILWIRYRHIKCHYADSPAKVQLLNAVSFIFGFLTVVGTLLVSSFQPDNVLPLHLFGAAMIFLFGIFYCYLQTWLTYRLRRSHPEHIGCCTLSLRIAFSIMYLVFIILMVLFATASLVCRNSQAKHDICGAYPIVSAFFEWLSVLSFLLFLLTFHPDFQRIHVDLHIKLRHHHNDTERPSIIDETTPLSL